MEELEKRAYLRNIVIIARSDGEVSAQEKAWLARVQTGIGAHHAVLQEVLNEFGDPEVDLNPIRRLSDRVRCIEDMVSVAICDSVLDSDEREHLINASLQAGLSQDLVNLIIDEATERR